MPNSFPLDDTPAPNVVWLMLLTINGIGSTTCPATPWNGGLLWEQPFLFKCFWVLTNCPYPFNHFTLFLLSLVMAYPVQSPDPFIMPHHMNVAVFFFFKIPYRLQSAISGDPKKPFGSVTNDDPLILC